MNISFDKTEFCKRLAERRKSKGMTQKDVARELGISDKTYSKWETGEGEPDLTRLCCLSRVLDVSVAYMLGAEYMGDDQALVTSRYDGLSHEEAVQKSFELQFYTIRGLAKKAFENRWFDLPGFYDRETAIPENRINSRAYPDYNSITAYSTSSTYHMMYNGSDANLSLTLMPAKERMSWLCTERAELAEYFSLLGEADFLCCLAYMASLDFPEPYSAAFLAETAGVPVERASELLVRAEKLGICHSTVVHSAGGDIMVYRTQANQFLTAILTFCHLAMTDELAGHFYMNGSMRQKIDLGGEVK